MAELSVGAPTGDQSTTQSPQTAPTQTIGAPKQAGNVQPGTAASLLTDSQGGVGLSSQPLTTVSLKAGATTTGTTGSTTQPAKPAHHMDAALFIIPIAFCVAAIAMFWVIQRSAKSTTN